MTNQTYLPYAKQNISEEDLEAVAKALSQPIITRGELVEQFESALADYCGADYAVAFNSGTAALMAAYYAGGIGPSDRILTTPNTFVSSVGSGIQRGATPIFLDIERKTGNIDVEQVLHNMNQPFSRGRTAIVPVHFSGIPVDMATIYRELANTETLLIEDAAHALGSHYLDESRVGNCQYSDMTIFSFHPAKTITTGEGGMVLTNQSELYRLLRLFRNNGLEKDPHYLEQTPFPGYYEVVSTTGNYNVTEIQAALGFSQLKRIDLFIEKRRKLWEIYKKQLESLEHVQLLSPQKNEFVAPHLCVVLIDFAAYKTTREAVMFALDEKSVGTQVHYIPVYKHPFFTKASGDLSEYFPEMETYYAQALSLPLYFDMREEDVYYVVDKLKEVLAVG